jgi:iron complex transport system substrate-binding protein
VTAAVEARVGSNFITLDFIPRRVVSLVPSLTESLFDLGLGEAVVGITDYCIYPAESLKGLPRLGGTKNPRIAEILALKPDLVLANQEENTPGVVKALERAGEKVWVSFPKTIRDSMQVLHNLAAIFKSSEAYRRLDTLDRAVDLLESGRPDLSTYRYFCPIWRGVTKAGSIWWMTFNRDTYANNLLYWLGGENVFADRVRRFPLEADLAGTLIDDERSLYDTRYPRLSLEQARMANPDLILLPNEPFAFNESHRQEILGLFPDMEAVKDNRVYLVDGSLVTWHGTRLGKSITQLPAYFNQAGFL